MWWRLENRRCDFLSRLDRRFLLVAYDYSSISPNLFSFTSAFASCPSSCSRSSSTFVSSSCCFFTSSFCSESSSLSQAMMDKAKRQRWWHQCRSDCHGPSRKVKMAESEWVQSLRIRRLTDIVAFSLHFTSFQAYFIGVRIKHSP